MAGYRFYPPADAAQDSIWSYTAENWGDEQAERYIRELHSHLGKLAKTPTIWRKINFPSGVAVPWNGPVYLSRFQHHILFFRPLSEDTIGIISILHSRMDLPVALARDLESLANKSDQV